jgi:hypothetical protein
VVLNPNTTQLRAIRVKRQNESKKVVVHKKEKEVGTYSLGLNHSVRLYNELK